LRGRERQRRCIPDRRWDAAAGDSSDERERERERESERKRGNFGKIQGEPRVFARSYEN